MNRTLSLGLGISSALLISALNFEYDNIPTTWDLDSIKHFHLPPPDSTVRVRYVSEDYYNRLGNHIIYKTYPVFVRESERQGYFDSLRSLEPVPLFDPKRLVSQSDWIKAGELVFNWPVAFSPVNTNTTRLTRNDFDTTKTKLTRNGRYLFNQYVIAEKGKLMVGSLSCASCHTRILDSGEIVPGGQGNVISNHGLIKAVESGAIPFPVFQAGTRRLSYAPWAPSELKAQPQDLDEIVKYFRSMPTGVVDRQGVSYLYPVSVPSLIGIKDIKYLDHTGLMKHDNPGDMMRYAAFNQGLDMLTSYDGYIPGGDNDSKELPELSKWNHPFGYAPRKYTDAQLFALTQYIYSLQPPRNPNKYPTEVVKRGKAIFAREGCVTCHTPPLYTNNKLTPANGFTPPATHVKRYYIFNISVETDSVSTLYSRRGTGYYKIPSLRGVWFRSAFFHNGQLTKLEDVLDPKRLQPEYIPSGYMPPNVKAMPVKGHPFGLELNEADKKALIAFLKTL